MAFDPHIEDFQRLGLRYVRDLDSDDPFGAARSLARFGKKFSQNRDSLPQTDGDRAFHLVAKATDLIDYQLPFAGDAAAAKLIEEARKLLEEAVELDACCHDARRMLAAADNPSFEDYYRFLATGADEVRQSCEDQASKADAPEGPAREFVQTLCMLPYLRWLASLSARALECGHYRKSVEAALALLAIDPYDQADVRFTLALDYAKLEDAEGLSKLVARDATTDRPDNPWYSLARLALAYKVRNFTAAEHEVAGLLATHPEGASTLAAQDWLPDGVFSRIVVEPGSEDELVLAVSEATVILQEGVDSRERGALGSWLLRRPKVAAADTRERPRQAPSTELGTSGFGYGPDYGSESGKGGRS